MNYFINGRLVTLFDEEKFNKSKKGLKIDLKTKEYGTITEFFFMTLASTHYNLCPIFKNYIEIVK